MAEQPDVVGGAPITSTWGNLIRDRTVMPFTNAASRAADIPTGTAGQLSFLTDTNTLEVFNGTAWVCVSPKGAAVTALQNTTSGTYTDLTTVGPAVTVNTGTKAVVMISGLLSTSIAGQYSIMAVSVTGATTLAAADGNAMSHEGTAAESTAATIYLTGLTAGANTFTAKYRVTGGTGSFEHRRLVVIGEP